MGLLEVPVFTVEAALEAFRCGAHRLELCSDFSEGGTTPSAGLLQFLKSKISIPIFVMIRPRGGDFIYTEEELEVMEQDISILGASGADGFVFGILDENGMVDRKANERLLKLAENKPCTFHRAFDLTPNLKESLNKIQELGFDRILTSGGKATVSDGWDIILELVEFAQNRIIIMPGGGSHPRHARELQSLGLLKEIHASCKSLRSSSSVFKKEGMNFSLDMERFHQVLTINPILLSEFLAAME
ncbi:copper homeostasis protein CutC [Mongoliitalea daihaiensis]|uniref:copper homeostasis protein CutC n=1 Tax=Mongoliitalea daihaiensis TaxID=2782006 RepID=UPI001F3C81CD|nr:copper homeostasis protein CutC [Mongoliitalea daihaiensis]UJP63352.1 copper homeostasis protein CutC [Mongoliitalea daihaiensis]